MMNLHEIYSGFRVERKEVVNEVNGTVYLLHHEKSGARLLYIETPDTNKVFSVSFRTPPKDSTGVAHITEHSVLCGSRKFPLKEPFVELVKGSLNTFLNAMTYPDKTMYPVASKNDKDFRNLMDVYLDAVFYPRVATDPEIIMQEGWHYELNDPSDELTYKGVVYNEMKGVYSSGDSVLETHMMHELFPDTTYGVDSGGNPDNITDLTYEGFQEFYHKFYHPSNSYIYLYGDMDIEAQLKFIDEEYLSGFDAIEVDSEIKLQTPFNEGKVAVYPYNIGSDEEEAGKAIHSYTFVMPELTTAENLAFEILTHALLNSSAAPLKEALVKAGIGHDVSGYYLDSLRQPIWSISVSGSDGDKQAELQAVVDRELRKMVADGLDKVLLEASLNSIEFTLREADFGGRPIGLAYGIRVMDGWIYDRDPIALLHYEDDLKVIREGLQNGLFEGLIEKCLLTNTHKALVSVVPEKGLQERKEAEERKYLATVKANMSTDEVNAIVEQTKKLKARQEAPDSEEALATIPLLELSDLSPEVEHIERRQEDWNGTRVHFIPTAAKGINYTAFYFDMSCLTEEEVFYAQVLSDVLSRLDTNKHSYVALANELNLHLGGFSADVVAISRYNDRQAYKPLFVVRAKALHAKLNKLITLVSEIINDTQFADTTRLNELIKESKAVWATEAFRRGHTIVSTRVMAQVSDVAKFKDQDAMGYFEQLATIDEKPETLQALAAKVEAVAKKLFRANNVDVMFVGEETEYQAFADLLKPVLTSWPVAAVPMDVLRLTRDYSNQGIVTAGKVQYVAKGGNFKDHGFQHCGAMSVLETILRYEYLWIRIRVQGGAYGAFANFYNNGNMVFCSYRDPNLTESLAVYNELGEYLRNFDITDREMRKYIIGTMSNLDTPMTPSLRGPKAMGRYFGDSDEAAATAFRKEVIACQPKDIRGLADVIDAVMNDNHVCVMGNEQKIKDAGNVLGNIVTLP